jgi:hypothetical protein
MTKILAALGIVLLTVSAASAQCGCAGPAPVAYAPVTTVVNYAPAYSYTAYSYPAYGYATYYPAPYYAAYSAPYVVARPVVAAPVVYPSPYYVYYGRPWMYVPGQPVRNALRATFR